MHFITAQNIKKKEKRKPSLKLKVLLFDREIKIILYFPHKNQKDKCTKSNDNQRDHEMILHLKNYLRS